MVARVKICCIASREEARTAIRLGASALGLVSEMPSGPGVIPEDTIREIAETIPPGVSSFLLTSRREVASIVAQQRRTSVNTIQLVDELPRGAHEELRNSSPCPTGRGPVVGRKNHYGSRSKRGTDVAALFYTLCETAKLQNVDPRAYMLEAAYAAINQPGTVLLPDALRDNSAA